MIDKIKEFNKAFNLPVSVGVDFERQKLFRTLIEEEIDEYWEAVNYSIHRDNERGLVYILDALVDITYLTIGAYVYAGEKCTFHHKFINEPQPICDKNKIETYRNCYNYMMDYLEKYEVAVDLHKIDLELELILNQVFYLLSVHGLLSKFPDAVDEVHNSNMSKLCDTLEDAEATKLYYSQSGVLTYHEEHNDKFIVYRKDGKVLKGINYFKPNLKKLF